MINTNYSKDEIIRMSTYSTSIVGIVLYILSALLLDSAPYVALLLVPFVIPSIIGVFSIEKKPSLAKTLLLVTATVGLLFSACFVVDYWQNGKSDFSTILYFLPLSSAFILFSTFLVKKYTNNLIRGEKKESSVILLDAIIIHITTLIGIILYIPSAVLLYPIGYFASTLMVFLIFSVVGFFFIYKRPNIAKNLLLITVTGAFLTILSYILTTEQIWTEFNFVFGFLGFGCLFLLSSACFLNRIK